MLASERASQAARFAPFNFKMLYIRAHLLQNYINIAFGFCCCCCCYCYMRCKKCMHAS